MLEASKTAISFVMSPAVETTVYVKEYSVPTPWSTWFLQGSKYPHLADISFLPMQLVQQH